MNPTKIIQVIGVIKVNSISMPYTFCTQVKCCSIQCDGARASITNDESLAVDQNWARTDSISSVPNLLFSLNQNFFVSFHSCFCCFLFSGVLYSSFKESRLGLIDLSTFNNQPISRSLANVFVNAHLWELWPAALLCWMHQ